jgi:hypothetical protein
MLVIKTQLTTVVTSNSHPSLFQHLERVWDEKISQPAKRVEEFCKEHGIKVYDFDSSGFLSLVVFEQPKEKIDQSIFHPIEVDGKIVAARVLKKHADEAGLRKERVNLLGDFSIVKELENNPFIDYSVGESEKVLRAWMHNNDGGILTPVKRRFSGKTGELMFIISYPNTKEVCDSIRKHYVNKEVVWKTPQIGLWTRRFIRWMENHRKIENSAEKEAAE